MDFPILKKVRTINIYPDVIHKETAKYNVYVIKYEFSETIKVDRAKIILQGMKDSRTRRMFDWKVTFIHPIQHVVKRVHSYYATLNDIMNHMDEIMSAFRAFIDLKDQ